MTNGWIPAWRKLYDPGHFLAPNKRDPSNRRDAWLDLCQLAQHQPRKHAGFTLKRGEVVVAVRNLAERWGWSKSRVSRFLICLTGEAMIETVSGTASGTVYRIVNYDTYATVGDTERDSQRDTERDASGTAAGQEQPLEPLNKKSRGGRAKGETAIPEGWQPTTNHADRAAELGLDLDREAEVFRAHAETHDRRVVSWNGAFTTWLLKADRFTGTGNRHDPRPHPYKPLNVADMPWAKDPAA